MSVKDYDGKKDNHFSIHSYNGRKRMQPFYDDLKQLSDTLDFLTSYKMESVSNMEVTILDTVYMMNTVEKAKVIDAISTIRNYKKLLEDARTPTGKQDRFYHYKHAEVLQDIYKAVGEIRNDLTCRLKVAVNRMLDEKHGTRKGMKRDGEVIYFYYRLLEKQANELYNKINYDVNEFKVYAKNESDSETVRKIEKDILDDKETKEN